MPPTTTDVARIAGIADPVARNLRITQCYFELSRATAAWLRGGANWCTFATWASKQAGQTIRGEDLQRALEDFVARSAELRTLLAAAGALAQAVGAPAPADATAPLHAALAASGPLRRSSDSVAAGNLKVFAEIGHEFARFLEIFGDASDPEPAAVERFCAALRPGAPPEGQQLLRDAFAAYAAARAEADVRRRAELMFHANLLVGLHEQTRLQPEIAAALDAAVADANRIRERLIERLLPGFWRRMRHRVAGLFGRRPPLDEVLDRITALLSRELRRIVTESLMTLRVSDSLVLRLGRDLDAAFPEELRTLAHPPLLALLEQIDPTPDSVVGSGARDWADLAQRMHFITDLFRCFHSSPVLFHAPFTGEQLRALETGTLPAGRL